MITIGQIRGILLEEVALRLLRLSGFQPVDTSANDPTLQIRGREVRIRGRGSVHQADALGDFCVFVPFSHPIRLIVEAKCLTDDVGLDVVRQAVGVMKDICEYFVPEGSKSAAERSRLHYLYAVFSGTSFTGPAQSYSFAHDVFLFPLGDNARMRPVMSSIRRLTEADFGGEVAMKELRQSDVREVFRSLLWPERDHDHRLHDEVQGLTEVATLASSLSGALIARANKRFMLFLTPETPGIVRELAERRSAIPIEIRFDDLSWYIRETPSGRRLFSFDLPAGLFDLYAESGNLEPQRAIDMKQAALNEIEALYVEDEYNVRQLIFRLDPGWVERVRESAGIRRGR